MFAGFRSVTAVALSLSLIFPAFAQQAAPPAAANPEPQLVKIKTNEVLLDLVVNDKKGKPILDLKPEEIEVYEDGVKQTLTQFRQVGAALPNEKNAVKPAEAAPVPAADAAATAKPETPPLNLVTLLFDHLPVNRVMPVRDAALNFVDNSVTRDMLVRVMVVGQKLYLIEQYTNDRAKLRKAVERAVSTVEKSFVEQSNRWAAELTKQVEAAAKEPEQANNQAVLLAQLSVDTLTFSDKLSREVRSNYHVFSLLPFARAHRAVPGRKMALYFSDGLYLPPNLTEVTRAAIGESNRANLSFYAVNIRNLLVGAGNQVSRLESATVVNQTRRSEGASFNNALADSFSVSDRVAGRERHSTNFSMFEVIDRSKELNKLGPLSELTEGTGGFQITNSNDLNGALKRIAVELGHYYLVSYLPSKQEYDGKFRKITVKLNRNGAQAQTRSGYFALPPTSVSRPVLAYETPLLTALNNAIVPHDFEFRANTLHFDARNNNEVHQVLLVEVPLANFVHGVDAQTKAYPVSFSVLAMVKDEKGEVVQRFSEPHELAIPEAMAEQAKKSSFNLVRHFWLPPGRYTLEAVAHDQKSNQFSAQRKLFTVAAPKSGLQTGSLFLVKEVEAVAGKNTSDPENPLIAADKRMIPDLPALERSISAKERQELSFHLAIYPDAKVVAKPSLKLELLHEGKAIAATTPALPEPDASGRINFTAGLNIANFFTGKYQFRALVKQGEATSEETVEFSVSSERKPTETADDKVIASSLANSDKLGELALVSLKESKPVELAVNELLQEVQKAGAQMFSRLGEYTYSLRKVRRVLNPKGKIRSEDYQDYEAYPVKGRHALIQYAENGTRLNIKQIDLSRKVATEVLIKSEEERQKLNENAEDELNKKIGYWGANVEGVVEKRGQPRRNVFITVDPEVFFNSCEFSAPRAVVLEGRETYVLDFKPRPGLKLNHDQDWIARIEGSVWIDAADKSLVRIEGQMPAGAAGVESAVAGVPLNFVYQQQRLAAGVWAPSLIRINAAGNEALFRGLNWDAWFEFNNFKRFDTRDSDVKIVAPEEKGKGN
jgi:VWFA-related protein